VSNNKSTQGFRGFCGVLVQKCEILVQKCEKRPVVGRSAMCSNHIGPTENEK
jgi:hypothetical protein